VWGPNLTQNLASKIERVEKKCLSIICRKRVDRFNYDETLIELKLEALAVRRDNALHRFGFKLFFSRYLYFLPPLINPDSSNRRKLRNRPQLLVEPSCKTDKYKNSTIPTLIRLVNNEYKDKETVFGFKIQTFMSMLETG